MAVRTAPRSALPPSGSRWITSGCTSRRTTYDLLSPIAQQLDIWETEYLQVLEGDDPVLEWVSATGLRPVLNGLDDADRATFLASYSAALREAYPQRSNGQTLYPFRRLFIVATKDEA